METTKLELRVPSSIHMCSVVGVSDEILKVIEEELEAKVSVRGNLISISGSTIEVQLLTSLFSELIKMAQSQEQASPQFVRQSIELLKNSNFTPAHLREDILLSYRGKAIRPKTAGQKAYVDAIKEHTITFGLGPAGTGKTYLAMAMAIAALKRKEIARIILTRPIVEAGENLGFLPGSIEEKVDPYVRPLYDALFDMTDAEKARSYIERGIIEIAPLAFMRGRSLNDAFVILDEAQNTTQEQLKMFLTRLGFNSKFVITGDLSQTDIEQRNSGLRSIESILSEIKDIAFIHMSGKDVVRHSLVAKIVYAYDKAQKSKGN